MKHFDFAVIGSGLGGLACATILSREGYNVCVLEKNRQIGGCLQTFTRHGRVFDTGVHYIGSLDKGQITNRLFHYFGIMDKLKLKRLDADGFDRLDINGTQYNIPIGYSRFIEELSRHFPEERGNIIEYCKQIKKVIDSLDLFNLKPPVETTNFNPAFSTNICDFLESITKNKKLQYVLGGFNFLYAGTSETVSLYQHATVFHSFIQSSYRPIGGSGQIADLLAEEIEKAGGTILSDSGVRQLEIEDGVVRSILLDNEERIEAKQVVSNIHPAQTMALIDEGKIRKSYRKRLNNIPNTISTFTLYICLKENQLQYQNYNSYHVSSDNTWHVLEQKISPWPGGYMFLTPAVTESDEYAKSAIILAFMDYNETARWENTSVRKRGQEYLDFKQEKAEQLLDFVEAKQPGLKNNVERSYTSSPLTYRDYTGTVEGSIYGICKDCRDLFGTYISVRSKISNLFFTGQNIGMHGVLGVSVGALQTCAEFIGFDKIFKQIHYAN